MNTRQFHTYSHNLLTIAQEEYLITLIQQHSKQKSPKIPQGVQAVIPKLLNIKAVVFDIYGTLLHSAAGEIHTSQTFNDMLFTVPELDIQQPITKIQDILHTYIVNTHTKIKATTTIQYPEIDAIEMWYTLLPQLTSKTPISKFDAALCAVYYELANNPSWSMPYAKEVLSQLHNNNCILGIVSNAQFYTPLTLYALFGEEFLQTINFPIQVWSYLTNEAKPSLNLFSNMLCQCEKLKLSPHEILYIGNDKLNDIYPAHQLQIKTLLFAGDSLSYRPRINNPELTTISPDGVITSLEQILLAIQ